MLFPNAVSAYFIQEFRFCACASLEMRKKIQHGSFSWLTVELNACNVILIRTDIYIFLRSYYLSISHYLLLYTILR